MFQIKPVENIKTLILRSRTFFFFRKSCRLRDNVERDGRARGPQMTYQVHALCMTDYFGPKNRHTQYLILTAFPAQYWLHERATVLRYTHTAYLASV
jgi:hypothetical protein